MVTAVVETTALRIGIRDGEAVAMTTVQGAVPAETHLHGKTTAAMEGLIAVMTLVTDEPTGLGPRSDTVIRTAAAALPLRTTAVAMHSLHSPGALGATCRTCSLWPRKRLTAILSPGSKRPSTTRVSERI